MDKFTRRSFLQTAGLTGVVAALGERFAPRPAHAQYDVPITHLPGRDTAEWIPSCCNMCGGQTGILCHVVNGRVVKIEPSPHNPNGFSNLSDDFFKNAMKEGAVMCPKGNSGIFTLYDPDRVKRPLKRTNPHKGIGVDPKWREISREEALNEIAAKLKALRDSGEAHKLLWFSEDHSFTHIQDDFCKLFGTPNRFVHSNLCDAGRKASLKIMMGDERPLADCLQSRYMLFFGWNPLSATKWSYLPRIITRALQNGAKMVVVDPYLSYTAAKATEWLPIRPGTDGALALAIGHVLIREGLIDKEFIAQWTVGFDRYADYVKDKTPQRAEQITSVPAKKIERIAVEFGTTKPPVADVWSGAHHSNGVYAGWAIGLLNALTGNIDKPGGLLLPNKKGNKHIEVEPEERAKVTLKKPRLDGLEQYPYGHKSGVYCETFIRLADGKAPYMPKMAVIIFQNLMMSVPGTKTVEAALKKLEFVVVVDNFLSETAQMADIVLPGTVYLERYDLNTHWVTWPVVGLRQPVVKPLFGQPTEYKFVTELGRRLGLKDKAGKEFFRIGPLSGKPIENLTAWYEDYLSKELKEGEPKITLEELKQLPGATWVSQKGTTYEKFKKEVPPEKIAKAVMEGITIYDKPKDEGGKQIGTMLGGKPLRGFFTPSGKIEFFSEKAAKSRDAHGKPMSGLPVYVPREWQPSAEYPLFLVNWKESFHTHTRTQNNPVLMDLKPDNPLIINAQTAQKLGIHDGDEVWVESLYGKVRARAKLVQGMHPKVVGLQHGFGHWAMGTTAQGKGTSDSPLRPTRACPISGQALHKECCVKVYKAQG